MGIRYQPKGTTADMMRLGARVGLAQGRAKRAAEESRYARQRSDELRQVRRDQVMRDYDDQMKLKSQQVARDWELQKMQLTSQRQFEMQMMRQEAFEAKKIQKDVEQYDKYQQAVTLIHESDDIEPEKKSELIRKVHLKYLVGGVSEPRQNKEDMTDMLLRQAMGPQSGVGDATGESIDGGGGKIRVKSPDGQGGTIEAEEWPEYQARGFKLEGA